MTNPSLVFWRALIKVDKAKVNNRWMAFRNALAVAVPLAIGISLGNPAAAAAVTTGALNVSFSDGRDPYYRRARRMLAWSVLGSFAVFVGAVTGNHNAAAILIATAWAFATGMLMAVSNTVGDLGLNTLVALVVFAGRAADSPRAALNTASLVLAGGLLQSAICLALWPVRRYAPERRAIANVVLELALFVDPDTDSRDSAFVTQRSQEEQDALAALGADHSVEGERFRMLFDQVDRLRLSTYLLSRFRDQLGEDDNQQSDPEAEAASTIDTFLRLSAKILNSAARELSPVSSAKQPTIFFEKELRDATDAARQLPHTTGFPLAARIASAIDVAAGQLRSVIRLSQSGALADTAQRIAPVGEPDLVAHFASWLAAMRANLDLRSTICRHAIRLSLCIAVGDWIERSLGWQRAYWLPMTIAVILKPDFNSTFSRGVLRLLGTFVGLFLATLLFHILPASPLTQLIVVGACTFFMRYLGPANYGVFSLSISGLVVFLIALTGVAPSQVIAQRALNTAVGGVLALIAYVIWPTWERARVPEAFADMIEASRLYIQSVFSRYAGAVGGAAPERERLAWLRTRSNVEASVDRAIAEPGTTAAERDILLSILASSHSMIYAIMGLEAGAAHRSDGTNPSALNQFLQDVDFTLYYLGSALRGSKPATQVLPELREDHRRLLETQKSLASADSLVLVETDRLTVSLNTLREQVMRYLSAAEHSS